MKRKNRPAVCTRYALRVTGGYMGQVPGEVVEFDRARLFSTRPDHDVLGQTVVPVRCRELTSARANAKRTR